MRAKPGANDSCAPSRHGEITSIFNAILMGTAGAECCSLHDGTFAVFSSLSAHVDLL